VAITNANFKGLSQLCDEFRFRDLAVQLSQFRESNDFKEQAMMEDSEARMRLSVLEERMHQRDKEIAALRCEFSRQAQVHESAVGVLLGRIARLEAEMTSLRSTTETVTAPTLTQLQIDVKKLKDLTTSLARRPSPSAPPIPVPAPTLPATSVRPDLPSPSGWNSVIVSGFPAIFEEFKEKKFTLLWRGSRDGFGACDFHSRCDGHANTLTVILNTNGNFFGGFTPVEWESPRIAMFKADPSLKSFLFTLKAPRKVAPRRFPLMPDKWHQAIRCDSAWGPNFFDVAIADNGNSNTRQSASLGFSYINDTGLKGDTVFTGSENFQAKEVEVFEITA
jgi:hypothetical protein